MKKLLAIITILTSVSVIAGETRKRINVLDDGITPIGKIQFGSALCKDGHSKNFTNVEGRHGTNVVSIIANKLNTKKFCIEIHNILGPGTNIGSELIALIDSEDAVAINLSFTGNNAIKQERKLLKGLVKKNIHIFVAAGNDFRNLDEEPSYPASYSFESKFYHVVGSSTKTRNGKDFSNFGGVVTETQPGTHIGFPKMTGTSQSTPNALNKFFRGIK